MGKGKRNRQFHFEDKQANPEKYKEQKKPFRMPKWATYTIWSALLVIVVAAIVLTSLANNGVFLRNRILLNSQKDNKFNLNQQMVTFIVWQNMYQSAYTEFLYTQYGLYEDTYNIVKTYGSADYYGISMAQYYTSTLLREGIDSISDYLEELVAGADEAVKLGLTLNHIDEQSVEEVVDFMKSLQAKYAGDVPLDNFLGYFVGKGVSESDVRQAATLMAMYTKYCDYTKFNNDVNSIKDTNNKNVLLDFIANNPSGHYEATYRMYQTANKEFAEKLKGAKDVTEFTKMLVDHIIEENFDALALNKFTLPKAEADEALILAALANKGNADDKTDDLAAAIAKAKELGMTETTYKKVVSKDKTTYTPELNETLTKWLFASARVAGNVTVLAHENSAYLIYVYAVDEAVEDKTANTTTNTVKAGIKEYKLSEDADKFASFKDSLIKDLNSEDRKNTTEHKSAEDLAKVLYDEMKKDEAKATLPESAKTENVKKPGTNETSTAIQNYLFADSVTIAVGKFYQIDDDGTSYVLKVNSKNGESYNVSYVTFKDSDYYHFFRAIKDNLDTAYPSKAPTLSHPESSVEDSFEEWICEADVTEKTETEITKRTFKRLANEIEMFPIYKTDKDGKYLDANNKVVEKKENAAIASYKVYIVVKPMELLQKEDTNVYGGYLKYDTEAAANEALNSIKDLKGYELWQAFGALTTTNTTGEGDNKKTTEATATLKTNLKKADLSDENLQKWMLDENRMKTNVEEIAVVKSKDGKAFYLAYFKSAEQEWTRSARDEWIASEMKDKLEALVKDGGYKLDENILNKIGAPAPTTEETTTEAPKDETTAAPKDDVTTAAK